LLAAATSLRGKPSVTLNIRDKRLRWANLHWADGSAKWTDQVADSSTIHRVRSNGTDIEWCKVTTVGTQAQWTAWTVALATDLADQEVAIARLATGDIRIYTLRQDVADTTWDIVYIDSTDSGANWDAAWSLAVNAIDGAAAGDPAEPPRIAATVDIFLYTRAGSVHARALPWGGVPGAEQTWADLGVLTVRGGIGACYKSGNDYLVAAAGAGNISIGVHNSSTPSWTTARQIAPGGIAPATDTSGLRNPSVLYANSLHFIAWLDDFDTPAHSWTQPVVLSSTDFIHFGNEIALSIWATTYRRVALAYIAATKTVYAANEKIVCHAPFYESDDALQNLTSIEPTIYRRDTTPRGSKLHIEVLSKARLYDTAGQTGEYGQCIRALSTVELNRGYHTTSGHERETLDPHYIVTAKITQGVNRSHLIIDTVDGWGLLDLWHSNETLTWTGETIAWLLTEICARVGLAFTAASGCTYALPTFTVTPGQSGAQVVRTLLQLGGAIAFFTETGALKAYELYGYSPAHFDIGDNSEIIQGDYALGPPSATSFRIFGSGAGATGEISWQSMTLGLRVNLNRQEYRLATDAACLAMERLDYTLGRMITRNDWVLLPMRPDAELWDRCRIFPNGDVIPPADCIRRIVGIKETWDAKRHHYHTTLETQDA